MIIETIQNCSTGQAIIVYDESNTADSQMNKFFDSNKNIGRDLRIY